MSMGDRSCKNDCFSPSRACKLSSIQMYLVVLAQVPRETFPFLFRQSFSKELWENFL